MSPEKCRDFRGTGPRIASNQMNLKFNKRQEVYPHTLAQIQYRLSQRMQTVKVTECPRYYNPQGDEKR